MAAIHHEPCWLGIDIGGTAIKAGLYDERCAEISSGRRSLTQISPQPGYAERNMTVLRDYCYTVIKEAIARGGVDPRRIRGVAVSAQGKGLYPIARDGSPALGTNGILSADRRAVDVVRRWQARRVEQQLYPFTRQTLWTGHPVSILRWLKEERPDAYANIAAVMMAHDYLRFCLCGERAVELTNFSESNLFNMTTERVDPRLAELTGLEDALPKIPPLVASTAQCGTVTPAAAELSGLAVGTPVYGGLFDVNAVAITSGLHDGSALNISIGTWSVTTGIADALEQDPHPFVYGRHPTPGRYIIHEASPTSSGNMEWICRELGVTDFDEINRMVATSLKRRRDVYFIPFLYGSNASLDATAGFYGLQAAHDKADLFAAGFEGVVFAGMKHVNSLRRKFTAVSKLVVTGGPARSPVWMQILADTSGLTLEIPQLQEPGCLGAALVAMAGTDCDGDLRGAQARLQVPKTYVEPRPDEMPRYAEKLYRYNLLVDTLSAYHETLNAHKQALALGR